MKVNFEITENHALTHMEMHIDLHNNFEYTGFNYDLPSKELVLNWVKSTGDWVAIDELKGLALLHKGVTFIRISKEIEVNNSDDSCLGELSFYPSDLRGENDSIITKTSPDDGDDILYFFENGDFIRINCQEIELIVIPA